VAWAAVRMARVTILTCYAFLDPPGVGAGQGREGGVWAAELATHPGGGLSHGVGPVPGQRSVWYWPRHERQILTREDYRGFKAGLPEF
jgi:hypothetical protein